MIGPEKIYRGPNTYIGWGGPVIAMMKQVLPRPRAVDILLSYHYAKLGVKLPDDEGIPGGTVENLILDSGAFSAASLGAHIDIDEFGAWALERIASDSRVKEVVSLDVIGDWRATLKNTEYLWSKGLRAMPTYHIGEPEDYLLGIARDYPKICIGGIVPYSLKVKRQVIKAVVQRVWPKAIHALGITKALLFDFPLHSSDTQTWIMSAMKFGRWQRYCPSLTLKGEHVMQAMPAEADYYETIRRQLHGHWNQSLREVEQTLREWKW